MINMIECKKTWGYKLQQTGTTAESNYRVSLALLPSQVCIGHYFDPESALAAAQAIGDGRYLLSIDADWVGRPIDHEGTGIDTVNVAFTVVRDGDDPSHPLQDPDPADTMGGLCYVA